MLCQHCQLLFNQRLFFTLKCQLPRLQLRTDLAERLQLTHNPLFFAALPGHSGFPLTTYQVDGVGLVAALFQQAQCKKRAFLRHTLGQF